MKTTNCISKILSSNDTGQTGGHQAGILIPKQNEILDFFPQLNKTEKNPRYSIKVKDPLSGIREFSFIYYNNKFFGGTRNEYRLTGMTRFIRDFNLKAGDEIILNKNNEQYTIDFSREIKVQIINDNIIKLGSSWRVIKI